MDRGLLDVSYMRQTTGVLLCAVLVAGCAGTLDGNAAPPDAGEDSGDAAPPDAPPDELQTAMWGVASASLPFLAKGAADWIDAQACTSCHAVPVALWSHARARDKGLAIDATDLADTTTWAIEQTLADKITATGAEANLDGAYQLVLGRDSQIPAQSYEDLAQKIERGQVADGSWPAGGQLILQRRSATEIQVSSTMTALLALHEMGRTGTVIDNGLASLQPWLTGGSAIASTEALALRAMIEHEFGAAGDDQSSIDALLARQNADGGWSWLDGEASDALATGQVLYALARVGITDPAPIRAAWMFLKSTQQPDGSWVVPSTKQGIDGPLYTSNQWGSGWAVIGLLETLPGTAPSP